MTKQKTRERRIQRATWLVRRSMTHVGLSDGVTRLWMHAPYDDADVVYTRVTQHYPPHSSAAVRETRALMAKHPHPDDDDPYPMGVFPIITAWRADDPNRHTATPWPTALAADDDADDSPAHGKRPRRRRR